MTDRGEDTVCIACSIFRRELEALRSQGELNVPVRFLDSTLHVRPEELQRRLTPLVEMELEEGRRVILAYGDCHARMIDLESRPGVTRVPGVNCCEIVLGSREYGRLRKQGVFFVLPEWAARWREFFETQLGLGKDNASDLMREAHSRLLYLDTGLVPVPAAEMRAMSDFCGLPWEVMKVSLDNLSRSIGERMDRPDDTEV